MNLSSPVVHKTRSQVVLHTLREWILSGQIKGGQAIRQSYIAEQLNVSRIPVREALVQLDTEGLVNFEPHKGATATLLSVIQVTELFELRAMIEADLLAKAIPNLQDEDLDKAEQVLTQLELAFKLESSVATWSELNMQFHTCLYQAAGRAHTLDIVKGLNTHSDRYIRLQLLHTGGIPTAEREHRALLDFCKNKDVAGASELLRQHILGALAAIKVLVEKQLS
ncbi:GntR family transcriptional regulator [Shewanella sp. SR44-3]|uniref:GntR family transcriptional regulator n=1 Tax=unclassified Shewanella TaxID=196818 RepID=UPI0015FAE2FC|nr:GntR family transcriptional regulator [Shewanella sp. SR44-3]MBB1268027.1 GntR family transcriptional regulator [Shewanella sp. SR44-3]